jgi:predicted AlkP superfamily pyrophosphatase or phosphodiesterase
MHTHKTTYTLQVLFLSVCIFSFLFLSAQSPKVIVIGFDGLSGWGISQTSTPVFANIKLQGASTLKAKAVLPTSSSSNWASMIMGASPNEHGIKSNKWKRTKLKGKSFCNRNYGQIFPTIFGVLREQKPDSKIYAVHHWNGFARLTDLNAFDKITHTKNEFNTAKKAIEIIKEKQPDFLFLHFDHCDHAGHEYGHETSEYFEAIKVADSLTGAIIEATKSAGTFEQTYFIVTSDHGGIGKGHGGKSAKEVEIPWLITGPKIKPSYILADHTVNQYDTAATLAYIFGIKQPDCWIAKPISEAFTSSPSAK